MRTAYTLKKYKGRLIMFKISRLLYNGVNASLKCLMQFIIFTRTMDHESVQAT